VGGWHWQGGNVVEVLVVELVVVGPQQTVVVVLDVLEVVPEEVVVVVELVVVLVVVPWAQPFVTSDHRAVLEFHCQRQLPAQGTSVVVVIGADVLPPPPAVPPLTVLKAGLALLPVPPVGRPR